MASNSWWTRKRPGETYWEAAAGDYANTKWNKKQKRSYAYSYENRELMPKKLKSKMDFDTKQEGFSGFETDKKLAAMRKEAFTKSFYGQKGMDAWKGNEWMKKSLDQAWDKDEFGIRSAYTSKWAGRMVNDPSVSGDGDTPSIAQGGGYGGYQKETVRQLTHTYAAKAQEMFNTAQQQKEQDKLLAKQRARGGMGSRGSTMLTGGREGVLAEAKTKRQTLVGAEG